MKASLYILIDSLEKFACPLSHCFLELCLNLIWWCTLLSFSIRTSCLVFLRTFVQTLLLGRGSRIVHNAVRPSCLGNQTFSDCLDMSCWDKRLFWITECLFYWSFWIAGCPVSSKTARSVTLPYLLPLTRFEGKYRIYVFSCYFLSLWWKGKNWKKKEVICAVVGASLTSPFQLTLPYLFP